MLNDDKGAESPEDNNMRTKQNPAEQAFRRQLAAEGETVTVGLFFTDKEYEEAEARNHK